MLYSTISAAPPPPLPSLQWFSLMSAKLMDSSKRQRAMPSLDVTFLTSSSQTFVQVPLHLHTPAPCSKGRKEHAWVATVSTCHSWLGREGNGVHPNIVGGAHGSELRMHVDNWICFHMRKEMTVYVCRCSHSHM